MSSTEPFVTRVAKVWQDDDGVVHVEHLAGAEVGLEDAEEIVAIQERLAGRQKIRVLMDIRYLKSSTRAARRMAAGSRVTPLVLGMAAWVGSPVSRVIGNFFLGFNKPEFPFKLFTSESEALAWLRSLKGSGAARRGT